MLRKAFAQALYPWIADPSVNLIWFSRIVYAILVAIAVFGHKECLVISQIIGIQIFFSLMGMNRASQHSLKSRLLHTLASGVIGMAFSAVVTLSLFCFEEVALLVAVVTGGTVQHTYVSYLSLIVFVVLATTWFVIAGMSKRTKDFSSD